MKIGIVAPEFPPDTYGGGGIVFESLARGLHERGHDVRVLTSSTHGAAPADDSHYPFAVARVAQFKHFTPQYRTWMPPLPHSLFAQRRFLAGCDVVHLHGYGVAFVDAVFNLLVDARRAVFTTHGLPYTARRDSGLLGMSYKIYNRVFGSNILSRSCRVTAVSSQSAQEARAASGREVAVIPNGFTPLPPSDVLTAPVAGAIARGRYLLCVGRIEPLKGFDLVVRALRGLRDAGSDLRLIVAGSDNTEQAALGALIESLELTPHVSFTGRVARPELMRLYEGSAACVVSSYTESFSLVTLEAMSNKAPCVLSNVGGIRDIAADRQNALLFEPGNVEGIVRAVTEIESSPELRARLVEQGLATLPRFAWNRVIEEYEGVYGACAGSR